MDQKEANEIIARKISEAEALIAECENIADEAGVRFSIDIGCYGMGGSYRPLPKEGPTEDNYGDPIGGWLASSQSC